MKNGSASPVEKQPTIMQATLSPEKVSSAVSTLREARRAAENLPQAARTGAMLISGQSRGDNDPRGLSARLLYNLVSHTKVSLQDEVGAFRVRIFGESLLATGPPAVAIAIISLAALLLAALFTHSSIDRLNFVISNLGIYRPSTIILFYRGWLEGMLSALAAYSFGSGLAQAASPSVAGGVQVLLGLAGAATATYATPSALFVGLVSSPAFAKATLPAKNILLHVTHVIIPQVIRDAGQTIQGDLTPRADESATVGIVMSLPGAAFWYLVGGSLTLGFPVTEHTIVALPTYPALYLSLREGCPLRTAVDTVGTRITNAVTKITNRGVASASSPVVFFGTYHITVDDKKRIKLPVDLLNALKESEQIVLELDSILGGIRVFSYAAWDEVIKRKIQQINPDEAERYRLETYGRISIQKVDKQGRITLYENLRTWINLKPKEKLILVGAGEYFVIFTEEGYRKYMQANPVNDKPSSGPAASSPAGHDSNVYPSSEVSRQRLEGKASPYETYARDSGITIYLSTHPGRAVSARFLPTILIDNSDLPYPTALREPRIHQPLPGALNEIPTVNVEMPKQDVFLVSRTKNGSQGVIRLGYLADDVLLVDGIPALKVPQ